MSDAPHNNNTLCKRRQLPVWMLAKFEAQEATPPPTSSGDEEEEEEEPNPLFLLLERTDIALKFLEDNVLDPPTLQWDLFNYMEDEPEIRGTLRAAEEGTFALDDSELMEVMTLEQIRELIGLANPPPLRGGGDADAYVHDPFLLHTELMRTRSTLRLLIADGHCAPRRLAGKEEEGLPDADTH